MNVLVMSFFPWHVKVNDFVLVSIVNVESCLKIMKIREILTLMWSSDDSSFSTTEPRVCEIASKKVVFPTLESPTRAILNLK